MHPFTRFVPALGALVVVSAFGRPPALSAQDATPSNAFRRGDSNADGSLNISDPTYTLNGLFLGGPAPSCRDAADANDDGNLDISDGIFALLFLFAGGDAPPAPGLACGFDPTADGLDCAAYVACAEVPEDPVPGQSEFLTPVSGPWDGGFFGADGRAEADAGAPQAAPPAPDAPSESPERIIEEADLYRLVGDFLYVLNHYRGLYVIDIADLDNPRVVGRAPIFGYPQEMYVRGNTAYILNSDYYRFWQETGSSSLYGYYGSQVVIADISDPAAPRVVNSLDLDGYNTDSRIVGDVLYVVTFIYSYQYYCGRSDPPDNKTQVTSIQVADPLEVRILDQREFPRDGYTHHIHATSSAIYLAASGYSPARGAYVTDVYHIDISDPAGAIRIRDSAALPGRVIDRWALDVRDGVLRVASDDRWPNGRVLLSTFDVRDPDAITALGRASLAIDENLTSARFDSSRGYLVTFRNIDPLFVFDLSDPRRPTLLGELEMSGWLDFMVPLGDRLVALGHELTPDPRGWQRFDLAVSLIDVSLGSRPDLLSRVVLDGLNGWVPAERDDFAKVFKVLPEQELVLFPFRGWSYETYQYTGGVQLIDYDPSVLTRRGIVEGGGFIERGIPYDESTVIALSTDELRVADIADRDRPQTRGLLDLARNVIDFSFLGEDMTLQLAGDWWQGDTQLVVTPLADPDAASPLSRYPLPSPYGTMFRHQEFAYVASRRDIPPETEEDVWRTETRVQVVDFSDPLAPRERGSVTLPQPVWLGYHYWYWGYGDEVVQVDGSTLAFHPAERFWFGRGVEDGVAGPVGGDGSDGRQQIFVVDLSDPDAPVHASTVVLEDVSWAWGLKAQGSTLFLSTYKFLERHGKWYARYLLHRIDVSDPANPVVRTPISIPGMFIDASEDLSTIYTFETRWDHTGQRNRAFLYALALLDDRAHFLSRVELTGYVNSVQVEDDAVFASTSEWVEVVLDDDSRTWRGITRLVAVDASDPAALRVGSAVEVPYPYAYLQEVGEGRAFLGSGPGLFVYDVEDVDRVEFERFFRTQGWVQDIVLRGSTAYLPSGYYGVQVLELGE